jgi:peroxiredoxin
MQPAMIAHSQAAVDFELTTLDGKVVKLSDYRGKNVILNFWAYWCPPCREEMPVLQKFYDEREGNFVLLTVSPTEKDSDYDKIKNFSQQQKMTFPILVDTKGTISNQYRILSIPTTFFINPNGDVVHKYIGPLSSEQLHNIIHQMR